MGIRLLNFSICDNVNYVMFQNNMDLIKKAVIQNNSAESLNKFTIEIKSDVNFISPVKYECAGIGPNQTVDITEELNNRILLNQEFFLTITEKTKSIITLNLRVNGIDEIANIGNYPIEILPFNYWPGVNSVEMIASFVTPNAESVKIIRSAASDQLKEWKKNPSLEGYQRNNRNRVVELAAAIYSAFKNKNINYVVPPAGFENEGQRIRSIDDVLTDREGTCIDLSVAYASALESIDINTVIFITREHAFAGFWLSNNCMSNIVSYENNNFVNLVNNNEMRLVECTCLTNSSDYSFDESNKVALAKLKEDDEFICGIDIKKSRSVYKPLPVRKKVGDQWIITREETDNHAKAPDDAGIIYGDVDERTLTKEDKWKRELLDITNRNSLINMKMGTKILPFMTNQLNELQKLLLNDNELSIVEKPQEWDGNNSYQSNCFESEAYISNYVEGCSDDLSRRRLRTPLSYADMVKTEKSIYRLNNKELEESGCNALFVGLGLIKWCDSRNDVYRYSPIILIPVTINKKRDNSYTIKSSGEDTVFNITMAEKLRQEFGIRIPNFDPLNTDDNGCVNLEEIFQNVTRAIDSKGWTVLKSCVLGIFSFGQYAMWKDLDSNMSLIEENLIVKSMAKGRTYPYQKPLDCDSDPCGLCLTMPADSSQIIAVKAAAKGKTFVMHGPPGTGKSQTITNIISNSLYNGKTVLFVAEKRAALEVVQKRLEEIGIGDSCLELHSNKTEKTKVMEQLRRATEIRRTRSNYRNPEDIAGEIEEMQHELDEYVSELHRQRMCGLSVYDCVCRYEHYHTDNTVDFQIPSDYVTCLKPGDEVKLSNLLNRAYNAYGKVNDLENTVLQYIKFKDTSITASEKIIKNVDKIHATVEDIKGKLNVLSERGLPFTFDNLDAPLKYFAIVNDDNTKIFTHNEYKILKSTTDSLKNWIQSLEKIIKSTPKKNLSNIECSDTPGELFNNTDHSNECRILFDDGSDAIHKSVETIQSMIDELHNNHEALTEIITSEKDLAADSLLNAVTGYDFSLSGDPTILSEQFNSVTKYLNDIKTAIRKIETEGNTPAVFRSAEIIKAIEENESVIFELDSTITMPIDGITSWAKSVRDNLDKIITFLRQTANTGTAIDETYLTNIVNLINDWDLDILKKIDSQNIQNMFTEIDKGFNNLFSIYIKYTGEGNDVLSTVMFEFSAGLNEILSKITEISQLFHIDLTDLTEKHQILTEDCKKYGIMVSQITSVFKDSAKSIFRLVDVKQMWDKADKTFFLKKKHAQQEFLNSMSPYLKNPNADFNSLKNAIYAFNQCDIDRISANLYSLYLKVGILSEKCKEKSEWVRSTIDKIQATHIPVWKFSDIADELRRLFNKQQDILVNQRPTVNTVTNLIGEYNRLESNSKKNAQLLSCANINYDFIFNNRTELSEIIKEEKRITKLIAEEVEKSKIADKIDETSILIDNFSERLSEIGMNADDFKSTYDSTITTSVDPEEYEKLICDYRSGIKNTARILEITGAYDLENNFDSFYNEFKSVENSLTDWAVWNNSVQELDKCGLTKSIELIKNGMDRKSLIDSLYTSLYRKIIEIASTESDVLRSFNADSFESLINEYKNKDLSYMKINRKSLIDKLTHNSPDVNSDISGSESAILYKAINAKRIRKSIRTLLSEIPNLLPKICPCLLMSPQSVSQYITMDFPKFDIVIFDESSQIVTSKAIGTLGRGKSAIIAGDSRQLPPTTFFHKKMEIITGDDDMMDIDSFLDDCIALNMPETYLEWHYRSTHESLISFSNRMFYDNKMLTFPSPNDSETKVRMKFIEDGIYNGNGCNEKEAEAIAKEIYRRVMDEKTHGDSIGVIAFSSAQQRMIEDKLDEYFEKYSEFYEQYSTVPEGIFIKNLETVQGDERDVILFSIGYGLKKSRKFLQNFGPINQAGGGRRLNVAVSRARKEMIVFSSIKYSDVKIGSASSQGVVAFREFLRYAESGGRFTEDIESENTDTTAGLTDDIIKELSKLGYECKAEIGHSEYKVDVGIVDPKNPSNYLLGVLLDGDSYRTSNNTRDREYARSDVLSRLGWNLMHVWSLEWFYRKKKTLNEIISKLKELDENRSSEKLSPPVCDVSKTSDEDYAEKSDEEDDETECKKNSDKTASLKRTVSNSLPDLYQYFVGNYSREDIKKVGKAIIERESPINECRLYDIYASSIDGNISKENKNLILYNLRRIDEVYFDIYIESDGELYTYWKNTDQTDDYNKYGQYEKIEYVPIIEIRNAIKAVLELASSIPKDKLIMNTAHALGFEHTGSKIKKTIECVVDDMLDCEEIKQNKDRLTLPDTV